MTWCVEKLGVFISYGHYSSLLTDIRDFFPICSFWDPACFPFHVEAFPFDDEELFIVHFKKKWKPQNLSAEKKKTLGLCRGKVKDESTEQNVK